MTARSGTVRVCQQFAATSLPWGAERNDLDWIQRCCQRYCGPFGVRKNRLCAVSAPHAHNRYACPLRFSIRATFCNLFFFFFFFCFLDVSVQRDRNAECLSRCLPFYYVSSRCSSISRIHLDRFRYSLPSNMI